MRLLVFGDVLLAFECLAAFAAPVFIGWHGGLLHANFDTHAQAGACEHVLRSPTLSTTEQGELFRVSPVRELRIGSLKIRSNHYALPAGPVHRSHMIAKVFIGRPERYVHEFLLAT